MGLVDMYLKTHHFFNAILLLEKLNMYYPSESLNVMFRHANSGMHDVTPNDVKK
jgi:hypothetical protein